MAGVFSFLKKKSASSVKFYLNNVASNWWPDFSGNSDTSDSGIAKTAEELPDVYAITDYISQIVANIPEKLKYFISSIGSRLCPVNHIIP